MQKLLKSVAPIKITEQAPPTLKELRVFTRATTYNKLFSVGKGKISPEEYKLFLQDQLDVFTDELSELKYEEKITLSKTNIKMSHYGYENFFEIEREIVKAKLEPVARSFYTITPEKEAIITGEIEGLLDIVHEMVNKKLYHSASFNDLVKPLLLKIGAVHLSSKERAMNQIEKAGRTLTDESNQVVTLLHEGTSPSTAKELLQYLHDIREEFYPYKRPNNYDHKATDMIPRELIRNSTPRKTYPSVDTN